MAFKLVEAARLEVIKRMISAPRRDGSVLIEDYDHVKPLV
jgi:hypothetical protein